MPMTPKVVAEIRYDNIDDPLVVFTVTAETDDGVNIGPFQFYENLRGINDLEAEKTRIGQTFVEQLEGAETFDKIKEAERSKGKQTDPVFDALAEQQIATDAFRQELSATVMAAIDALRADIQAVVATQGEIRAVLAALRADQDNLTGWLQAIYDSLPSE